MSIDRDDLKVSAEEYYLNSYERISDHPIRRSQYGEGGYTAQEMKQRQMAPILLLKEKLNALIDAIAADDPDSITQLIKTPVPNPMDPLAMLTLGELLTMISAGNVDLLKISDPEDPTEKKTLREVIDEVREIAKEGSDHAQINTGNPHNVTYGDTGLITVPLVITEGGSTTTYNVAVVDRTPHGVILKFAGDLFATPNSAGEYLGLIRHQLEIDPGLVYTSDPMHASLEDYEYFAGKRHAYVTKICFPIDESSYTSQLRIEYSVNNGVHNTTTVGGADWTREDDISTIGGTAAYSWNLINTLNYGDTVTIHGFVSASVGGITFEFADDLSADTDGSGNYYGYIRHRVNFTPTGSFTSSDDTKSLASYAAFAGVSYDNVSSVSFEDDETETPVGIEYSIDGGEHIVTYVGGEDWQDDPNPGDLGLAKIWTVPEELPAGSVLTIHKLSSPSCLSGSTLVLMADGTEKRIADVKEGEYVLAVDQVGNTVESYVYKVVRSIEPHESDVWIFSDGTTITTTGRHRFLHAETNHMDYITEIQIGDHVYRYDGTVVELTGHQHVENQIHGFALLTGGNNYVVEGGLLTGNRATKTINWR